MKKLDWKHIVGAAFFVAALIGSGVARAFERSSTDPNQNIVCSCTRNGFNTPNCQAMKNQVFGTGGVNTTNPAHGAGAVMPQTPAQAPAQNPGA
jgi:hypothetical protein